MKYKDLTEKIIGAAIAVHTQLGPGFIESAYEEALCIELKHRGIPYERQKTLPVYYRDELVCTHRLDLVVEQLIIVELKAVSALDKMHFAMLRSYLKAADLDYGLLINFSSMPLAVKRVGKEFSGSPKPSLHS